MGVLLAEIFEQIACLQTGFYRILAIGSLGIAVMVMPAIALLVGGSATAARTGGLAQQFPMNLVIDSIAYLRKRY